MQNLFKSAGLTGVQTEIYEYLLNNGELKASVLARDIKRPRGVVYKGLDELIELGLVEKRDNIDMVSLFRAEHPGKLEQLFEAKQKQIERNKKDYTNTLPNLVSLYNLASNKPGIKFLEGREGMRKILEDSLKSKSPIYLFLNSTKLEEDEKFKEIDREYIAKRKRKGIIKKIIDIDDPEVKKLYAQTDEDYKKITKIKFMPAQDASFISSIQIYENKISYQIFTDDTLIAVLIEDKNIYQMHKLFFEFVWSKLSYS